ncbi:DUF7284 family protein [Haloarcula litorea]|uniref:DUF7284 family protein n=1 Tax=Haloarcula litorea TaxID=3032579 RepID=UPI0023E85884|nr:hypothetical protein [Halomicroarcula sp. GDY20]
MTRATSTVLDATLCLLLVGAAATVVVDGVDTAPAPDRTAAVERADLLASSTASVEYRLRTRGEHPDWVANGSARHRRTAHGTLAALLADAAMTNVSSRGRRLSTASVGFERRVRDATRDRLAGPDHASRIRVHWTPYRGAPLSATTTVGERPPPSADVRSVTLAVASPMEPAAERARRAAAGGDYRAVAAVVARSTVGGLFPPEQTRLALHGDYPADRLMANRYRRAAALTGAGRLPGDGNVSTNNARLAAALTDRFAADMRRRFASPPAAADAVRTGRVTLVVRTWSR